MGEGANCFMRRFARVLLLVVGSLVTLAGLAVALLAGPDDTVSTGERDLTSETAGFVIPSSMLDFMGPTLHVAATAADGREIFVGVGHEIDVAAYWDGVAVDHIQRLRPPTSFELGRMDGAVTGIQPAPDSRDWWYVDAVGPGSQEIAYPLGAEPVNAVVMTANGEPPLAMSLELGLEIENLFITAVLVLAAGLALLLIGAAVLRRRRRRHRPSDHPVSEPAWHGEKQP